MLVTPTAASAGREPRHLSYGEAACRSEVDQFFDPLTSLVAGLHSGGRHGQLRDAALRLGSLVGGGELTRERAEAALCRAGRTGLNLPDSEVSRTVSWGLDRGMRSPRTAPNWDPLSDRKEAILQWVKWWENIDPADFPGTKGSTLLRVLASFALAGMVIGKLELGLSVRQIAEQAGLSTSTVSKLLRRGGAIERSGYLRAVQRVRPGHGTTSTIWKLVRRSARNRDSRRKPYAYASACRDSSRLDSGDSPPSSPELDVWHNRSNAWRIYQVLDVNEEVTVAELVRATGLHPATVRAQMAYLADLDLAVRVDRCHWRGSVTRANADMPARDGREHARPRRERHADERADYRAALAERIAVEEAERADYAERVRRESEQEIPHNPVTGEILDDEVAA